MAIIEIGTLDQRDIVQRCSCKLSLAIEAMNGHALSEDGQFGLQIILEDVQSDLHGLDSSLRAINV